ncbi:alginate export family protein [Polaribacter batillariae]|uniref:Alginate export family protein n=1 Tax=Polaribacter batillariae TaxID=2808900 RepID=A0ABX7SRU7_9FLAO|nr:alginate export family protein [Polaribacter batillariae]QTD36379.1 alginate export family protein [Polaribacter batillariae]
MTKISKLLIFVFIATISTAQAQLKIDAEIRPRFEYRHGFKTLIPDNTDAAAFVSQRTRLNTSYLTKDLNFFISLQDVRVWGDVPQLNTADNSGLTVHQAFGEFLLNPNMSIKLGRQEVIYDDHRIFGNVGWAQQARSHDLALLKYRKDAFSMDLGFAFNQSKENITGTTLVTPNTYKALQYAWLHKDWNNFSGSLLFLNNGTQFIDVTNASNNETRYSQTLGTHLKLNEGKFAATSNLYYQFGNDVANNEISAYLLGLETTYKFTDKTLFGLGVELQSGNENGAPSNGENKAFSPFYGTNHKFNGLMDYFYVGNHANNVGLLDLYAKANFKLNSKSSLTAFVHQFSAAAAINNTVSKNLGTELDVVYGYNFSKDIKINAGYSQMFASEGMEVLKGNSDGNTNNWGWLMVTIKPTLFSK